ncbi:MAG: PASTA domain-containing protein [Muribaculaceae bacterium]|nr:PASTA domain-containing protein [Muribaculaceae bacterium]
MAFSPRGFYAKHPIIGTLVLISITGIVLIWAVMIFLDHWTMHGETSVVPDVRNKSYAEARQILASSNLGIEISDSIYDRNMPRGTVMETMPRAGAVVKKGRQVYVTVTAFAPKQVTVTMPLQGNVSERQAISYLRGLGISDIRTVYVPSEYTNLVVGARYGDTPISVGTVLPVTATVTLEIGMAPVASPDFEESDSLSAEDEFEYSTLEGLSED